MHWTRRLVQVGFLALTLAGVFVFKGNAEAWCPFGGVEAMYSYAAEGSMLCSLGVSSFYALAGVLLATLLLRRAFCGYVCPIGTISELLHSGGRRMGLKQLQFAVTGLPDAILRSLKYIFLVALLILTWQAAELVFRAFDPCYALISRHGEDITYWAYVVSGAIVVASLLMVVPFCRWLCPLAAVMNPLSRFGLIRIKRIDSVCMDCTKCAKACPAAIPVDKVHEVTHARCIACSACIDVCPPKARGALVWGPPSWMGGSWPRGLLVAILFVTLGSAVAAAYLAPFPSYVKTRGQAPKQVATVELHMHELNCRGRATLLLGFLQRDDIDAIRGEKPDEPGFFRLEAWPGPGLAKVRVTYDPRYNTEQSIRQALTEPYWDEAQERFFVPPFKIE